MNSACSVEECSRPAKSFGWCSTHYAKWRKYGDPSAGRSNARRALGQTCSAEGCGLEVRSRGLCDKHRQRLAIYGDALRPFLRAKSGEGTRRADGYILKTINGVTKYEHVLVAERALGKPLPKAARVHHVDENPSNNDPTNLVICPDDAYHLLLHQRMRAFAASGHYDWRLCCYCSTHDAPENLHIGANIYHRACNARTHAEYLKTRLVNT